MLFMDVININSIKKNSIVKFITSNKTLFDGIIKKVSNNYLGVTIDIRQSEFKSFTKDEFIEFILVCEHQAIRCSSVILGLSQSDFEQAIIISMPKPKLAIERREFQRLSIVIDIEYSPLPFKINYENLNDVDDQYFKSFRKTCTLNISAGGISIVVPKNEINFKYALMSISLKNEKIVMLCESLRTESLNNAKYDNIICKYTDIKVRHRQLILDFVSEKSKENNNSLMDKIL